MIGLAKEGLLGVKSSLPKLVKQGRLTQVWSNRDLPLHPQMIVGRALLTADHSRGSLRKISSVFPENRPSVLSFSLF